MLSKCYRGARGSLELVAENGSERSFEESIGVIESKQDYLRADRAAEFQRNEG